ncbi:putative deoxycytidylate deaminase [Pectobacterium atrosepticum SCRI1043]|uniref:Deoxycytidylate deaminase n=2 Tax=Pectobacterium atrosepticum TaxID=29471 RepID=Q6DAX3_PECAS|nr:putative deoxycytidylate deaminase [Pectobacterium atrosepticum SCRI1043]
MRMETKSSASLEKTDDGSFSQVTHGDGDNASELVIGLVGAVGTNLDLLKVSITEMLKAYSYEVVEIRISKDIIKELHPIYQTRDNFKIANELMTAGNRLREKSKNNAVLSMAISALISSSRVKDINNTPTPNPRKVYIIHSLKHPDEVNLLREVYTNGFYLIGVYANEIRRIKYLVDHRYMTEVEAKKLISRDADEDEKWGQHTRDTYELSDFFVNFDNNYDRITNQLWRFFDLIFGKPNVSPTFDEYAMSMAYSASLRSADLSRQVGAVLTKNNMILTTGANDIPAFGGGLYWPIDTNDSIEDVPGGKDYTLGYDSNAREKKNIISDILERTLNHINACKEEGIFSNKDKILEIITNSLNKSKIKDITEYGRVVHAEMEAILSCARSEINTNKATIYCTTFPCHNCAKHIVASGIEKVIYIEPYPKSKAFDFHIDSITSLENPSDKNKVIFEPFVGVGPRCFFNLFSINLGIGYKIKRKDSDGNVVKWERRNGRLRIQMLPSSYIEKELKTADSLNNMISQLKGD